MSGNAIHKLPPRERSLRRSTISGSSRATLLGTSEGSGSGDGAHMSSIKGFASKWRNRKANRVASDARMSQRYHVIRGRLPEFQTALRKRMSNRSIDDHHLATSPIHKTALQRAKGRICSNALLSDESDSEGLSCSEVEEDYWDSDDDRRRNLGETLCPPQRSYLDACANLGLVPSSDYLSLVGRVHRSYSEGTGAEPFRVSMFGRLIKEDTVRAVCAPRKPICKLGI